MLGCDEIRDGESQQDDDENHRDSGRYADILVFKALLPKVKKEHGTCSAGATFGEDEDVVNGSKRIHKGNDCDENGCAAKQGESDFPKGLPAVGAIQGGCFENVCGEILQAGKVKNHVVPGIFPDGNDDDGK